MFPAVSAFRPIYDAVLEAFRNRPLIPRLSGGHAAASALVLGRSKELRDLLPSFLLNDALGENSTSLDWVDSAVTENRFPKVWRYLRDECGIQVIDNETFARRLTECFLESQNDEWIVRFYTFLTGQEALWRAKGAYSYQPEGLLRKKPIIRCEDGQHRYPFDEFGYPIVFLPIDSEADHPIVRQSVYQDKNAAEFLRRLGLVRPDLCTKVISSILPLYQDDTQIELADHEKHLSVIRDAMRLTDSPSYAEMMRALKGTPWVLARNAASGKQRFEIPESLFEPSRNLRIFFEGNEDVWFLADTESGIDWKVLRVDSQPVVHCQGIGSMPYGYVTLVSYHGWHKRGLRGFDPDTEIEGLEQALSTITLEKAAYIWNELLPPLVRFLHGEYEEATRKNYSNAVKHEVDSDLCKLLKAKAWIPVGDEEFSRPEECTVADMAGELKRNEQLARALGLRPDPKEVEKQNRSTHESLITQAGFAPHVAALLVEYKASLTPQVIAEAIATHAGTRSARPEFPERPVQNPKRRIEGVRKRVVKADPKSYKPRKRSVRTSAPLVEPKIWLREMYTNARSITVCQMCRNEMPFRVPSTGDYYFEAVQIADNFSKEDHCLYLALCPLCAAKYSVLVKRDEDCLSEFIWAIERGDGSDFEIPVQIDNGHATVSIR